MKLAVAVMARAPVAGRCKTRLLAVHDPEWVAALYAAMLADTLASLGRLDAAVQLVFVAPLEGGDAEAAIAPHVPAGWEVVVQRGDDLGARMEHAFELMFVRGATCAVVAGSDAPMLGGEPLAAAVAGMGRDGVDVLLAPCDDGGYALVALTRRAPALFASMTWSAPTVLAETRARAAAAGLRVRELAKGYDVDEPADVQRLAAELAAAPARARALTPNTARVLAGREQVAEVAEASAASAASNASAAENAASSARRPRHTPQA